MIAKIMASSADCYWPQQSFTFNFGKVEVCCEKGRISVYSDDHELEFVGYWELKGFYKHARSKKPEKLIITVRDPIGYTVATIDIDLKRRFKPVNKKALYASRDVIARSEGIGEGQWWSLQFGRDLAIKCSTNHVFVVDRFVEVSVYGDWEVEGYYIDDDCGIPSALSTYVWQEEDWRLQHIAFMFFRVG